MRKNMSTKLFEDERGISNLIATLILIGVAVVGGGFAYTVFRNQASTTTTSADLQVQGLDAVRTDGTAYLSTTVKNVGTQQLVGITVTVDPEGAAVSLSVGDLDPGQSGSADNSSSGLSPGQTYPVRITASTPSGGSITKTTTVRVQS